MKAKVITIVAALIMAIAANGENKKVTADGKSI